MPSLNCKLHPSCDISNDYNLLQYLRRHWLVLILEIAIPAALMLALVGLKSLSNPKESTVSYPATYWQDYQSFEQLYQYCPCDGENLVWR